MAEVDRSTNSSSIGYSDVRDPRQLPLKEGNPFVDQTCTILQGPLFEGINALSADPQWTRVFLQCLSSVKEGDLTLAQAFLAHDLVNMSGSFQHMKNHWFDNENGWWPGLNVEDIMTRSLEDALSFATSAGLPLQSYWLIYEPYAYAPKANTVFARIAKPLKPSHGDYADIGVCSILYQFFTPARPAWLPIKEAP